MPRRKAPLSRLQKKEVPVTKVKERTPPSGMKGGNRSTGFSNSTHEGALLWGSEGEKGGRELPD